MTNFTKRNLITDGPYIIFAPSGIQNAPDSKVVACFKRGGGKGTFMTCLRKNFTVEEYFARRDAGETPLDIAGSAGYILPHIKRWLKDAGYPQTPEGFEAWLAARPRPAAYGR